MTTRETIPYRPLGLIVTMLENIGFQVSHWHEDLVFIEHNAFLLQMGEKGKEIGVWFNVDCESEKKDQIMDAFKGQEPLFNFQIDKSGAYKLVANQEDETLQIEFITE